MRLFLLVGLSSLVASSLIAETLLTDFSKTSGWRPAHSTTNSVFTEAGLSFSVSAEDPWVLGPRMEFPSVPTGTKRVRLSLVCAPVEERSTWQLFYSFGGRPYSEGASCRLEAVGEAPYTRYEVESPVAEIGSGPCRLRLDPPDHERTWTMRSLSCEFLAPLWTFTPEAPTPPLIIPASTPLVLHGEHWELRHDPDRLGAFRFLSRGKTVENAPEEAIVYLDQSGGVRSLDWFRAKMTVERVADRLTTSAQLADADGSVWTLTRCFASQDGGRSLTISTEVSCSREASILHVPFLTLFAERASKGHKHQAMLAGVEYLEDEPSSNEKEIRTREHNRQIPAGHRFTAPLAVLTDDHNWLSATWRQPQTVAVVFDSPDRFFGSGGHLLAFWAPAVGPARYESEREIYAPTRFRSATQVVTLRTGPGATVAEALEGSLPARPETLPPPDEILDTSALETLAHGWLDSGIRSGVQVRHAVPFKWQMASDAPVLMCYLASELGRRPEADASLAPRLRTVAEEMLAQIRRVDVGWSGISHIRHPAPVLVAGDVQNWLSRMATRQRGFNRALASGKRRWMKPKKGHDLGETLNADHCNGFTAMELEGLLSAAVWSGDEGEIAKTLAIVDKVTELYGGTVPRGAQPWEMPLHTPDIVASARLVRSYVLAYLLKPDPAYLREAHAWAYTGLSMVYLVSPSVAGGRENPPVGRYATCGVMGATHWAQPNWIGRPVQWCGLVYADALWDLARIESDSASAFWRRIASGITASGVRQNHTAEDPDFIGLLPDSWDLVKQSRYAVPINPGTVQENLAEHIGRPFYSLRRLSGGSLIHVPGLAENLSDKDLRCRIEGWPEASFKVVVTRLDQPRTVTFNGEPVAVHYDAARRALEVTLPAYARGELVIVRTSGMRDERSPVGGGTTGN